MKKHVIKNNMRFNLKLRFFRLIVYFGKLMRGKNKVIFTDIEKEVISIFVSLIRNKDIVFVIKKVPYVKNKKTTNEVIYLHTRDRKSIFIMDGQVVRIFIKGYTHELNISNEAMNHLYNRYEAFISNYTNTLDEQTNYLFLNKMKSLRNDVKVKLIQEKNVK